MQTNHCYVSLRIESRTQIPSKKTWVFHLPCWLNLLGNCPRGSLYQQQTSKTSRWCAVVSVGPTWILSWSLSKMELSGFAISADSRTLLKATTTHSSTNRVKDWILTVAPSFTVALSTFWLQVSIWIDRQCLRLSFLCLTCLSRPLTQVISNKPAPRSRV